MLSLFADWRVYLGEVDELLEEVRLQVGGGGLGVGQVEVAGNLGNHGRVAIVLAIPAGQPRLIALFWVLDSVPVAVTCMDTVTSLAIHVSTRVQAPSLVYGCTCCLESCTCKG